MQHIFSENYCLITKSEVLFLPIIDLNSSDETCIYSTWVYIQCQAKQLNIPTACITLINLVVQSSRNHYWEIIKDSMQARWVLHHNEFLGSIGSMMKGSWLEKALEQVYGPNAVAHMMTTKAILRALLRHFLVVSALVYKFMLAIPSKSMESENDQYIRW